MKTCFDAVLGLAGVFCGAHGRYLMKACAGSIALVALLSAMAFTPVLARADDVVVGVNWYVAKPNDLDPATQEANLTAMEKAGIHVIRSGLDPDPNKVIEFLQRAKNHDIKIVWLMSLQYPKGVRASPPPSGWPWRNPGLSQADPNSFRDVFGPLFARLDTLGLTLAAFELDNEINWIGNGDFPVPGKGRLLSLEDLSRGTEGQRIAQGFLQYLKVLATLKEMRDHLKLNQHTPVISAGLADSASAAQPFRIAGILVDSVDINTTLRFLRANGLDRLVDGYSVHHYPTSIKAGTKEGADLRLSRMMQNVFAQCGSSAGGKPCWLTEWGFNIDGDACPVNESIRTALVREVRNDFGQLAQQGQLKGLLFFSWRDDTHAAREDHSNVIRCGSLAESGRLAIAPLR